MLSIIAANLEKGLGDYLRTTYPIHTPHFEALFDDFLGTKDELFKGPYLSIQLPFRQGELEPDYFKAFDLPFPPHVHQVVAFDRLCGKSPKSTLVATGTGSGKTESFLLPILEHCWRNREQKGIKAVIIYPMNALATDQAKRLAGLINRSDKLRGTVRAGLYVGGDDKAQHRTMGAENLITHRGLMHEDPPDILLTNYKMLDLLMVRPRDSRLWNKNAPDTLRFVVVDELHTFDGAQGTDLACLLRRLKARLGTPKNQLCCVGTSATLGGDETKTALLEYAAKVFGEPFDAQAVVGETRLEPDEFLAGLLDMTDDLPDPAALREVLAIPSTSREAMAQQLATLFFPDRDWSGNDWKLDLRGALKRHALFQTLLRVLRGTTLPYDRLIPALTAAVPGFGEGDEQARLDRLDAMVALAATAREPGDRPFVQVRLQKWLREMRRMVAPVTSRPRLRFHADLTADEARTHLPVLHCRDCGSMGWAGFMGDQEQQLGTDLEEFYRAYFAYDPRIVYLYAREPEDTKPGPGGMPGLVCDRCLVTTIRLDKEPCHCGGAWLPVHHGTVTEVRYGQKQGSHACPFCDSEGGMSIVGARAATMTSTLIDQLFASPLNNDKKLLTFSDSVQDASHRAGFFQGRTFAFTMRTAFMALLEARGSMPMDQVATAFQAEFLDHLTDVEFVARFLPPDLFWLREFETMKETGLVDHNGKLWRALSRRLEWEAAREFGFRSQIGRTLEKNGLAIAGIDLAGVDRVARTLAITWSADFGDTFSGLTADRARPFLLGVLRQMRVMGAIANPILEPQLLPNFNGYTFRKQDFLPPLGPVGHTPTFFATFESRRDGFEQYAKPSQRGTWLQAWTERTIANRDAVLVGEAIQRALETLWAPLEQEGLVRSFKDGKKGMAWALNPERLVVSREVERMRCASCGQSVSVPANEVSDWDGQCCLRRECRGTYAQASFDSPYYHRLYSDGDLERIYAAEHTGLLERGVREAVESSFMRGEPDRKPWDPNLLSCTPTLEMGIDIGDLSTVALCSVPPAQANYLQRIGRAGRRDGNALTLTIANSNPHDLYFYAEPLEMIAGHVRPPGVFLDAAMVLERQLVAYCFDQWVKGSLRAGSVPDKVGGALANLGKNAPDRFPQNFLCHVETNRQALMEGFEALFDAQELTDASRLHLQQFLSVSSTAVETLGGRLSHGFTRLQQRIENYQRTVRRLQDQITREAASPAQDELSQKRLQEMKAEDAGLRALIVELKDRELFGYLTDEGLLPNYAFPEPGVTLNSIIFRAKDAADAGGKYQRQVYSYERPASIALGELAPASSFYAEGRKVTIDQVDLSQSEMESWRFCPECHHAEHEILKDAPPASACPRCHSAMWPDAGQLRALIRMREVVATTSDRDSRATDDRDDRDVRFFERSLLVSVDRQDITRAFQLKGSNQAFGVEFLRRARFRDLNLGEKTFEAPEWRFAGRKVRPKGFAICRHCGKVQTGKDELRHAYACKSRDKDDPENRLEVVYLYREFESEALRLLLPFVSESQDDPRLASFIAALHLGLQRFFGGDIEHLRLTQMDEPIPDSSLRRRYLVLMDTVPGGTGYLKQLTSSPHALMDVLQLALDHLKGCVCAQVEHKDGCYRCVFRYRNSREMALISRTRAISLLSEVLKYRDDWEPVDTVESISTNPLMDSKLEELFLRALRRVSVVRDDLSRGKHSYRVTFGARTYRLELQVAIGKEDGVKEPMRADFVFYPEGKDDGPPVVVFTDGFAYHRDRLDRDFGQRMALWHSGRFRAFALGFQDVAEALGEPVSARALGVLDPRGLALAAQADKILSGFKADGLKMVLGTNAFEQLRTYLVDPDADAWGRLAFAWSLLTVVPPGTDGTAWRASLAPYLDTPSTEAFAASDPHLHGMLQREGVAGWVRVPAALTRNATPEAMWAALRLDDSGARPLAPGFLTEWLGVLRACNLLQFLPMFQVVTANGAIAEFMERPTTEGLPDDYQGALQYADPEWEACLRALAALGAHCPELGFELFVGGRVLGNCDLAWPDRRFAVFGPESAAMAPEFERHGWTVDVLEDVSEAAGRVEEWKPYVV